MFKTTAQGLRIYKREYRKYRALIDNLPGIRTSNNRKPISLGAEMEKMYLLTVRLRGMQMALGLTDREIKHIADEIGLVRSKSEYQPSTNRMRFSPEIGMGGKCPASF